MDRKQLYTAGIGILSVLFSLAVFRSSLPDTGRFFLGVAGVGIFLWAVTILFTEWRAGRREGWMDDLLARAGRASGKRANQLEWLNEDGSVIRTWELYQKVSALIGRDYKENRVDIDLGQSEYAAMVDVHHAVLNYADGDWYVEDLGSRNGVSVKKAADGRKYKISSERPCKLQMGDEILIGMCRLRLQ